MRKHSFILILLVLAACNSGQKEAQQTLERATTLYENAEYASAKQLLDSLKANYPKEVEIQKGGLQLMRKVELKEQERNLHYCDSMIMVRQAEADSLKPLFVFEKDPKYDDIGKYIDKKQLIERNVQRSYIRSGVNELGEMYLASVYYGSGAIQHSQLKVSKANGEYTETAVIPQDGGLNYAFTDLGMTTEVVTYQKGKDNGVIQFIQNNQDAPLKAEYIGKRKFSLTISPADKESLARIAELAVVLSDMEALKKEKGKAEKKIDYFQSKLK